MYKGTKIQIRAKHEYQKNGRWQLIEREIEWRRIRKETEGNGS